MAHEDDAGLPELGLQRFESLEPPERVLAELLPYRPGLIERRLHGAVALRLRAAGTWVEYVECSARTSMAMVMAGSGQALVMRREHDPIDRMCAGMLAAGAVAFGWAVVLGLSVPGGMLAWALCAAGAVVAVVVGLATTHRMRRRYRRGQWAAMGAAEWELTLAALDPMAANGATPSEMATAVDTAVRFS